MAQDHTLRLVEGVRSGDHDLIARRDPLQDLDLGEAGLAQADRAALGNVAVDDISEAAPVLIHEGTAIHHQHAFAPVNEQAHRQSLTLAQALRLAGAESQSRSDLAVDDLGGYPAEEASPAMPVGLEIGPQARFQITGETFGDLDL